jgi:hypothetical protein
MIKKFDPIYMLVTWLFDFLGLWEIESLSNWYYDRFYGQPDYEDADGNLGWLCQCGHWEESGLHCENCGNEPPWGCDCSFCNERGRKEYEGDPYYDPGYFEFDYEDDWRESEPSE